MADRPKIPQELNPRIALDEEEFNSWEFVGRVPLPEGWKPSEPVADEKDYLQDAEEDAA